MAAALTPVTLKQVFAQLTNPTLLNNPDGTGGFSGSVAADQSTRVMSIKVKFSEHEKAIKLLAGLPTVVGSGAGATVVRALPCQYPFNPYLYCTSIGIRAAGLDATVSIDRPWTSVILQCTFSTLPFDPKNADTPFMTFDINAGGSWITWPNGQYAFSSGEKIDADVALSVPEWTWSVKRYQQPDFDKFWAVVRPLISKVNTDTVTISKTAIAAGYLRLDSCAVSYNQSVLGTPQFTFTLGLQERTLPWNQGIRSDGVADTITPAPYSTAALSSLLT